MSIATALASAKTKINKVYDTIKSIGGIVPSVRNLDNISTAIQSVPKGLVTTDNISIEEKKFYVIFRTVDSEIARYSISEAIELENLPEIPNDQEYLEPNGWNWTIDEIKEYINNQNICSDIIVCAQYIAKEEKTYLFITIPYGGVTDTALYLTASELGGMTIEWGDGSTTVNDATTIKSYTHTYDKSGSYVIKISCQSGTVTLGGSSSSYNIFGSTSSTTVNYGVYSTSLSKAIIDGENIRLSSYAFKNTSVETVVFSNRTCSPTISDYAFHYCDSLINVSIPRKYTNFGSGAFYRCENLETISLPYTAESLSIELFEYCSSLIEIVIPSKITRLQSSIFYYCSSLQSVTIPNNVSYIYDYAFLNDYSLKDIIFPDYCRFGEKIFGSSFNVHSILKSKNRIVLSSKCNLGDGVIFNAVDSIKITEGYYSEPYYVIPQNTFSNLNTTEYITIPSSITRISALSFCSDRLLKYIEIPESVDYIGQECFKLCTTLKYITFNTNKLTEIPTKTFSQCSILRKIELPSSITSIGDEAFYMCLMLTDAKISSVTNISSKAFYECYRLKNVVFSDSLTTIGASAFQECYSISSIKIPSTVTSIGAKAFYSCYALQYVKYSTNTAISSNCFASCTNVRTYDFSDCTSIPSLTTSSYIGTNTKTKIVVPDSLYDTWITSTGWSTHKAKIVKASEYEIV